jgi:hypothetical protein
MLIKLIKNKNILSKDTLYFSIIILFVSITSYKHELWTDEGFILFPSIEYNFYEILDYFRYYGYFPLHNFFIKIVYTLTNNPLFSLKVITIIFFLISCLILASIKEIPLSAKILILLTYPITAEYSLINRHYIFFVPAIFYLILVSQKKSGYIFLWLSILNTSGPFGLIISFCYKICNYQLFLSYFRKKKLIIFFYIILTIICIYYLFPFDLETLEQKKFRLWNEYSFPTFEKIKYVLEHLILSINYVQDINKIDNIWSLYANNNKILKIFLFIGILQLLLTFFLLFKKNKKNFFFLFLIFILFLFAFLIQPRGDWRHYFIFTIIFYALSMKLLFINKNNQYLFLKNIYKKFFLISITLSVFISITFLYKDIFYNFSQGKEVAYFLKKNKIECKNITSYPPGASDSWTPYLDKSCKPYQFVMDKYARFHDDPQKHNFKYNNSKLFLNPKTEYIILKCELIDRNIEPCNTNFNYYRNLINYNTKNKVFYFNQKTLNGYEKFIIFQIIKVI